MLMSRAQTVTLRVIAFLVSANLLIREIAVYLLLVKRLKLRSVIVYLVIINKSDTLHFMEFLNYIKED